MPENLYKLMFHANKWGLSGYTRGGGTPGVPTNMLLTDIGKDSLNSRETCCITMSSSYHYVKIGNSVRECGFHKSRY